MYTNWKQVNDIIDKTLALEPDQRTLFLEKKLVNDPEVLSEAKDYLKCIEDADTTNFLAGPFLSSSVLVSELSSTITDKKPIEYIKGRRIGPFEIKRLLGEGGMGSVYFAERVDGEFSQQVAIKFLKSGFYSLYLRERFKREKQLLSRLHHPNIARLLDGGITEDGSPYLIMEYVEGVPLDRYCKEQNLKLKERLSLFLQICRAVQFAHSKLIIHRDLKPDNIFVTPDGQIKIMDFGIGKSLRPDTSEEESTYTQEGHIIASFDFAAPEQLRSNDVSIQTDIYGLGALLYLLATDKRVFEIKKKTIGEIEEIICEHAPVRPALRSESGIGSISGDLDAIILKTLRKEPENRYESVAHLTDDIGRLEKGLPVAARKGNLRYRAGKYIQRNKTALTATFLLFTIAIFFSVYHLNQLTEERNIAQSEAEKAQAVTNFLTGIFENASPHNQPDSEITAREVLEIGSQNLNDEFADQPEIKMSLLTTLGAIYTALDDYDRADDALRSAFNLASSVQTQTYDLALLHQNYGNMNRALGNFSEAAEHHEIAVSMFKELNIPEYEAKNLGLWGWNEWRLSQYSKADSLYRRGLDINMTENGTQHTVTSEILSAHGWLYHFRGENRIADSLFTEVLNFRRNYYQNDHPELAAALHGLGWTKYSLGEFEYAETLYEEAIAMRKRLFGDKAHSDTAWSLNNLGVVKQAQGQYDEAEKLFVEALEMRREVLPENHPEVLRSLGNLGSIYYYREMYDQSISVFGEILDSHVQIFGRDHRDVAVYSNNLATAMIGGGVPEQAIPYLKRALEIQHSHFKRTHPVTLNVRTNLAGAYDDVGEFEKAEKLLLDNFETLRDEKGTADSDTQEHLSALIDFYKKWDRTDKEQELRDLLAEQPEL